MVKFLADDTIFESLNYEYEVLEKRLREIAFLTKGLKITLEDTRDPENVKKAEFCYEGGLISFVEFLNKNKEKNTSNTNLHRKSWGSTSRNSNTIHNSI